MSGYEAVLDHDLRPGETRVVDAAETKVLIGRLEDGEWFAVDNACPHEGFPLAKGDLASCVLTCRWHNFRFDVRTGKAIQGDEDVRTWPIRWMNGHVELDVTPPDPDVLRRQHADAFEEAVLDGRGGQAAREVARLLQLGVPPKEMLLTLCRLDGRHSRYGTTHVLPLAADIEALLEDAQNDPSHQVLLVQQVVDVCIRSVQRFPRRSVLEASHTTDVFGELASAMRDEQSDRAEALGRQAAMTGQADALFDVLIDRCSQHFLGFGHGLIYTVKLRELGALTDPDIVGGLVRQLIGLTPEDVLPEWSAYRRWVAGVDVERWVTLEEVSRGPSDLVERLVDAAPRDAFVVVEEALSSGRRKDVLDALTVVACERVRRFDVAIDADPGVQNGWLDVTHILTFADAVRQLELNTVVTLRLVLQLTRFATHHRVLDGEGPLRVFDDPVAVARTRVWADVYTAPIVVAHVLKTAAAAERMSRTLPSDWSTRPLDALDAFVSQPVVQRFQARAVADACRFVFEGKVPRSKT